MTGEDLERQDLVISKLLKQDINKYRSLFPHVSAAIQLNDSKASKYPPMKGDTIQYIYTNSQHSNPLCKVVPWRRTSHKLQSLYHSMIRYNKCLKYY